MRADELAQSQDALVTRVKVDPFPVAALAALFDDGLTPAGEGEVLPALWHWAALASWPGAGATGADGHPRLGGLLPDVGMPRRMFAGGSVEFFAPLLVGEEVQRRDLVASITPKRGRQGEFVLVEVVTELVGSAGLAIREQQDLVYRAARTTSDDGAVELPAPASVKAKLLEEGPTAWSLHTDPTKLMRFSALTSNAHRIHYDLAYARRAEGYRDLVVHGPLLALAMAETLRLTSAGAPLSITHRGLRPLFCGDRADIVSERMDDGQQLRVVGADGDHATLVARYRRLSRASTRTGW